MGDDIFLTRIGIDTLKEFYDITTYNNITEEKINNIEKAASLDGEYSEGEKKLVQLLKDRLVTTKHHETMKFIDFNLTSKTSSNFDLKINDNKIHVYEGKILTGLVLNNLTIKAKDTDGFINKSKNDLSLSIDGKASVEIDFNSILRSAIGMGAKISSLDNPPGIKVSLNTIFYPEVFSLCLNDNKLLIHMGRAVQTFGIEKMVLEQLSTSLKISKDDFVSTGDGNYTVDLKKVLNNFNEIKIGNQSIYLNDISSGNIKFNVPNPTTNGPHTINIELNNTKIQAGTGAIPTDESKSDDIISAQINAYMKLDQTGQNYTKNLKVDGNAIIINKPEFDFSVDYQTKGNDVLGEIKINNFEKMVADILKETIKEKSGGYDSSVKVIHDNNKLKVVIDGKYGLINADLNIEIKDSTLNLDLGNIKILKLPALELPERAEKILKAYLPTKINGDIISIDINSTLNKYLPNSIKTNYKLSDVNLTEKGLSVKFRSLKEGEIIPPVYDLPKIEYNPGKENNLKSEINIIGSTPALTLRYEHDVYKLNVPPLSDPVVRVTVGPVISVGVGGVESGNLKAGVGSEARFGLSPIGVPFYVGIGADLTYGNLGTTVGKVSLGVGPNLGYDNGKIFAGIGYKREFVMAGKDVNNLSISAGFRF